MNALSLAIAKVGGQAELARRVGTTPQAVNNWVVRGLPVGRVLAIYRATRGAVTPHELRPDIYPDPDYRPALNEPGAVAPAGEAAA